MCMNLQSSVILINLIQLGFIIGELEFDVCYSETLNNEYIESIHQMSYSSLSNNGMLQMFDFLLNDYMELFKTVPAYSWLFIYFRNY